MTLKIKNFALYKFFYKNRRFVKTYLTLPILIAAITLSTCTSADKRNSDFDNYGVIIAEKDGISEIGGLSETLWGDYSTVVVGNKVVMGRGLNEGTSILIVDVEKRTVTEKGGLSKARWGYGTPIVGNKVLMPRVADAGNSILIIVDPEKGTVTKKRLFTDNWWGSVVGNKFVMGSGSQSDSILIMSVPQD